MILEIKKDGDPVLRQATEKVTDFGFEFQKLVDDMVETMRATGMGLAAPQVGVSKKLFVCEFTPEEDSQYKGFPLTVVVNPEIIEVSKTKIEMVEGCLSVPNREIIIKRPKKIAMKAQDRYGNDVVIKADGLYARALQHENDHLNATLILDHIKETKVIFIGTGSLGVPALNLLINDSQYKIVGVVTGDSRAKVRGRSEDPNRIYAIARKAGIPVIRTERIREREIIGRIKGWNPELAVMADFGQIVPEEILNIPKYGVVNIHPSLLPRHRGPSPIQETILTGDTTTGITLILTAIKMDAGPVIAQAVVELSGSETSKIIKDYLSGLAGTFLLESLPYYLTGELKPVPQDESHATYSRLFKKEDGFVSVDAPAIEVERKIRAFSEWPKVYTEVKGKKIQLLSSHFDEAGNLVIDRVKPEGKKEMSYTDFKNGYHVDLTFS